jgi:hypothetical protein
MSVTADLSKLRAGEFADRFRGESIPLGNTFSYFSAAPPLSEDDLKEYLHDPIAALPPKIASALPKTLVLLVPYLERGNGRGHAAAQDVVCLDKPNEQRQILTTKLTEKGGATLFFAVKDHDVAEYHYNFYRAIAGLAAQTWSFDDQSRYFSMLREELNAGVHGEVDEQSWHLKQALLRRQSKVRRETKAFRDYAKQSFIDTITLYLHGICCDIDVDTGPRQLPSRLLRKRLQLLQAMFPPPEGYVVFPEELKTD